MYIYCLFICTRTYCVLYMAMYIYIYVYIHILYIHIYVHAVHVRYKHFGEAAEKEAERPQTGLTDAEPAATANPPNIIPTQTTIARLKLHYPCSNYDC